MMKKTNFEEIEKLIEQLSPSDQLKLVARICERLSGSDISTLSDGVTKKLEKKQIQNYLIEYPKAIES
jgi:hypothetical protein